MKLMKPAVQSIAPTAVRPNYTNGLTLVSVGNDSLFMRTGCSAIRKAVPKVFSLDSPLLLENLSPQVLSVKSVPSTRPIVSSQVYRTNFISNEQLPAYLSNSNNALSRSVLQLHKASGKRFDSFGFLSEFLRAYEISEALAGLAKSAIVEAIDGEHNKVMAETALSNIANAVRYEDYSDAEPMIRRNPDDVDRLTTYVSNVQVSEVEEGYVDGLICEVLEDRNLSRDPAKLIELLRYAELRKLPGYSIRQIVSSAALGNDAHVRDNAITLMRDLMTYGVPAVLDPDIVVAFCSNIEDLCFLEIIDKADANYSSVLFQTLVEALNINPVLRGDGRVVYYIQDLLGKVEPMMQDLAPSLRADIGGLSRMI